MGIGFRIAFGEIDRIQKADASRAPWTMLLRALALEAVGRSNEARQAALEALLEDPADMALSAAVPVWLTPATTTMRYGLLSPELAVLLLVVELHAAVLERVVLDGEREA